MACARSIIAIALLAVGCQPKEDTSENVFASASASAGSTSDPTTTTTGGPTSETSGIDFGTGSDGGDVPATFRFDCVDIQGVGNADGTVIQAQVLENTWSADITNYKLNIMLAVVERDPDAGTASLGIRSGIGPDAGNLCTEPSSESDLIVVDYARDQVLWEPVSTPGECSAMATGTAGGTYDMALTADVIVYIYAEDDNTVTFNCTPDDSPDAVPIRAVHAQVSTNAEDTRIAGTLTGCLVATEAMGLCSCLATCNNDGPGDIQTEGVCAGCPTGGQPLDVLLGDVGTSQRCTDLVGADAYDLVLGFTATRLPNVPTTCQ
jgi:hypothetical protein